jgi:hypothetical protein
LFAAEVVANTTLTTPLFGITPEADLAVLALEAFRVVETLETVAGFGITRLRDLAVDVSIAIALLTGASNVAGRPPVVEFTLVAALSSVALLAVAHNIRSSISRPLGKIASVGVLKAGRRASGAGTWLAWQIHAQPRISIEAHDTAFTVIALRKVSTLNAGPSSLVASGCVTVALARSAVGEGPESGLALVALASGDSSFTALALSGMLIAGIAKSAHAVAVARGTSLRSKAKSTHSATVTLSAHHVGLAIALTPALGANARYRAFNNY